MYVEIVTPEAVLYKGDVVAITVPSIKGAFQILENHAPIIAVLGKGDIKLKGNNKTEVFVEERFEKIEKDNELILSINGGTVEQKGNRTIILAE